MFGELNYSPYICQRNNNLIKLEIMGTRIVSVTIERHYSKQATIEVEVDENIVGEELKEFLSSDYILNDQLEDALYENSLTGDDTIYEYQDPKNNDGGVFYF